MAEQHRFLHARIGRVDEWTVTARLVEGALPVAQSEGVVSFRRWARLEEFRGDLFVRVEAARLRLTRFARRSDQWRIRNQLSSWSRPFACYVELSGGPRDTLEGSLVMMRTALPGTLPVAPSVVLASGLLEKIEGERPRLEDLEEEAVLPSGDGPLMVVTTSLLLNASDHGAPRATIHLHRRWRLDCDIVGEPGAQHLVVREIDSKGSVGTIPDGRFIAVPRPPRFVATEEEAADCELGPMLPTRHDVIEAWIAYEQLERDNRLKGFEQRQAHPLEYTEIDSQEELKGGASFQVVLASPQQARESWVDPDVLRRQPRVRVAAHVEVADLDQVLPAREGDVVAFVDRGGGRLNAVVKLREAKAIPPVRGRLLAIEDEGEAKQRERRKRALDRLRQGTCANPELLSWLLNPAGVPSVEAVGRSVGTVDELDEHQRRAVALATRKPSIVLVLGPPGSGKTTVIRAIVDDLRHRRAHERGSQNPDAPFRILVTSIQNEAVDNVAEKVGGTAGIEVWHMGDKDARAARAERLIANARGIAGEIWRDLRDTPRFVAYERVFRVRQAVAVLRQTLFEIGIGAEVVERVGDLARGEAPLCFTTLLRDQLVALAPRLEGTLAPREEAVSDPVPIRPGQLELALEAAKDLGPTLSVESWADAVRVVAAISKALNAAGRADAEWIDLGERWHELHRKLRREDSGTISARSQEAYEQLRTDTITRLAARAAAGAGIMGGGANTDGALIEDLHSWVQRASSYLDEELAVREQQEEAVLFRWLHTLAEEPRRLEHLVERHATVTAGTCQRVDPARRDDETPEFDVVIVDEAARAGIDVLIPMTLGRSIVLVGDHRQLPPHIEEELEEQLEQEIRERVDLGRESLFSWLWDRLPASNVVSLSRQYRMHEDIGRAVSRLFYEPRIVLSHHFSEERALARRPEFDLCDNEPLVWIDTGDVLQDPVARREADVGKWPCDEMNHYEVQLITRLISRARLEPLSAWFHAQRKKPIGIVAFYGAQVQALSAELQTKLAPEIFELLHIGSVDSVQGREFPLVLLSTVRSNHRGFVGFLKLPNRMNVAMSRAQRQLILIGDVRTIATTSETSSPDLRRLVAGIKGGKLRGVIRPSAEVVR
jgi:energy-coupling factor transporter ATP-binding protein EcfA2